MKLNRIDRFIMKMFPTYTYKIFCIGLRAGFEWGEDGK